MQSAAPMPLGTSSIGVRRALAALSGALGFLAYPAPGLWPLIFVCYVPLMLAIGASPALRGRSRFALGWITGFVLIVVKHYFIAPTFVNFSRFPWAVAIGAHVAYAAYTACGWGLFAWGYGVIRRRAPGIGGLLAVAVWYGAIERWFPYIFPFYASSALYQVPLLLQTSDIIGSTGVTALLLFVQVALVDAIEHRSVEHGHRPSTRRWLLPAAAALVWGACLGYGAWRMNALLERPVEHTLQVALVQPNITIDEKRVETISERQALYERVESLTRTAAADGATLIVWPEGAFSFLYDTERVTRPRQRREDVHTHFSRRVNGLAGALGVHFVASGLRLLNDRVRNSAWYYAPGSTTPAFYDKRKLLWFGERIPFSDTFPALAKAFPKASNHAAGEEAVLFDLDGVRLGPNICYEALFPTFTREALGTDADGADVLLNLTNDVWFDSAQEAEHHLMVQVQRAIENRVWLLRATNSGISAFVDPAGVTRARGEVGERRVIAHEVGITALELSFYRRFGDVFYWLAMALAAGWVWWAPRRTHVSRS